MYLDVAGVHTYLAEAGSSTGTGAPVLFLHGVPDSADMWLPVIQRLQGHYQCYAPDLPGLGRSTAPDDFALTLDNMARYVAALVEGAAIPTPLNLVVTNFGAPYGLAWAVTHPESVRRIVIAGGANFFSDYQWHGSARMARRPIIGELGMALMRSYPAFARSMKPNAPALDDAHWRATYALSFANPSVRQMTLRMYRALDSRDFVGWEDKLAALTQRVPMLVLWGDQDPFISPAYADRYGAAGAERVEHFADHGHWLAVEAPELVADRVASFIG